ncbi:hypothetical protein [Kiloniella litopenaei]|nr:hypothetical protein [Kiloniella litopenaei]
MFRSNSDRGCDAYFFLMCAETFRDQKKLPIRLSPKLYLAEPQDQSYPPGFAIFLSLFPNEFLKKWHWLFSNSLDLVIHLVLFSFLFSTFGPIYAWIGGVIYATSPFLAAEYANMTSRPLGMIWLASFFLFTIAFVDKHSAWPLIGAILSGCLLFYTHKLAIQLTWFCVIFLGIFVDCYWFVPIILSYLFAFSLNPKLFTKILIAHLDIISFWNRNRTRLGAHLVRNSKVYGGMDEGSSYYSLSGFKGFFLHLRRIFQFNPYILVVAFSIVNWGMLSDFSQTFLWLMCAIYLWAFLTLFIPFLRCLGEGTKYIKYSIPLCIFVVVEGIYLNDDLFFVITFLAISAVQLFLYFFMWRSFLKDTSSTGVLSEDLQSVIQVLSQHSKPRLLCLPPHLCDIMAYHGRIPVWWGTHGYGFRWVEDYFPVLKKPVEDLMKDKGLTHLLVDTKYVSIDELDLPDGVAVEFGSYVIFKPKDMFIGAKDSFEVGSCSQI